jgi:uncharacterized protein
MITRRGFLKFAGRLALTGAALGSYAFAIEPGFLLRIQKYGLSPPRWPTGFKLRIAAIADIHAGAPHMSETRVEHIVDTANALGADLIVLMGDYRATHRFVTAAVSYERTAAAFQRLAAPLGVHAILGNHDWWDDREAQKRRAGPIVARLALETRNIPVYENNGVRLAKDGQMFWLLGLADIIALKNRGGGFTGVDDLPATLAKITDDAPAIMLIHEPDIFTEIPSRIALTIAGHTHGGQVRLFGWSPVVPSMYGNRYAYGHIIEDNRHLIVSGGLGCSVLPVRFGVPPEITLIDLA